MASSIAFLQGYKRYKEMKEYTKGDIKSTETDQCMNLTVTMNREEFLSYPPEMITVVQKWKFQYGYKNGRKSYTCKIHSLKNWMGLPVKTVTGELESHCKSSKLKHKEKHH